ncbi:MAG: hypothetical protein GY856_52145 [bacterium]|nr:hypothetical protein [bacterium]
MQIAKSVISALIPILCLFATRPADAAGPPCRPCAGIRIADPAAVIAVLAQEPKIEGEERLYVAWSAELDGSADAAAMEAILDAGGTPWMIVHFRTPSPILENLEQFDGELRDLARLAQGASERAHFQIAWQPPTPGPVDPSEYAFLLKRAAVAVTGGRADARVIVGPLDADVEWLRALYSEEVTAYVDGIALAAAAPETLEGAITALRELDPGKGVVVDTLPWPEPATRTLSQAAAYSEVGIAVAFFELGDGDGAELLPLKLLAREFQGDLSFDPNTLPSGGQDAWTFVRGEDLSLRVIAEATPGSSQLMLFFADPHLRTPTVIDLASGEEQSVFGQSRTQRGLLVPIDEPGAVALLRLERMSAAELAGLEEQLTVDDTRQLPVEEILRRLQGFEDAQARKLRTYQATSTMHLRFNVGTGPGTVEATFEGDFFFRRGEGFDWAWENFYVNGVKWRGKTLPELPIIQPEIAAALPLEIHFTKEYRYRLRGTGTAQGRDCWVVDFAPLEATPGRALWQGSVWIDRELWARVKTRALQVELEGEVISNEETVLFTPLDAAGRPAEWTADGYYLPTRVVGQQLFSILNATIKVEKETLLSDLRLNPEDFDRERADKHASEVTMVRETDKGLRYLVKDEGGERVVKEGFDTSHLFLAGGVYYDGSLDYPVPLAGIDYLSHDFRGSGKQFNVFFAGVLLAANIAEPRLFGSRWDAGANVSGFFLPTNDEVYRDGREVLPEQIETGPAANVAFFLGRPLGNFVKVDFTYGLRWLGFGTSDETAAEFILPQDTLTHSFATDLSFNRAGYSFGLSGSYSVRSDWEFWGLPDNDEFDPSQEKYLLWEVSVGKTWWLPKFMKFGIELDHLDGADLDRFSKYDFGFFGDSRISGYQGGLVRASESNGFHLNYGFELGKVIRVELKGDAVWASDEATGLEDELLAGVGLNGTLMGPWQTIINFDVGFPVEGPADDFVAYVVFLKLFR